MIILRCPPFSADVRRFPAGRFPMDKLSRFIVSRRNWMLAVMACLAVACVFLYLNVRVNYDLTKYLPDDSGMKKGMDVMTGAFPAMGEDRTVRVMARGLSAEKRAELCSKLEAIPHVRSVAHGDSEKYLKGDYALFVLSTPYEYGTPEERSIESALARDFREYGIEFKNDNATGLDGLPAWMLASAVALLVVILTLMCKSWFEPVLFLVNIGVAVVLNEGTNYFLGQISYITSSIAAVLQLVLSIDYSVMLMNRYRQERQQGLEKAEAMVSALRNCFSSISSSALTTATGLLALAFMHFKIGMDLGFVLAKGVLFSLLCVLTVLPGLVILGDRLVLRTAKKTLRIPMGRLAAFSYKRRLALTCAFAALFALFCVLQNRTAIAYTMPRTDPIADVFPSENMLVIVYENRDEEKAAALGEKAAAREEVTRVVSYPALFGKAYPADELAGMLEDFSAMGFNLGEGVNFDPSMLSMVYSMYFSGTGTPPEEQKLTVPQLFAYVDGTLMDNLLFSTFVTPEIREAVSGAKAQLDSGVRMLKGDRWSRMILYTTFPVESEQTDAFMNELVEAGKEMSGAYYLIGNSAMNWEMQHTFSGELWTITLLTTAAIFLIVLFSSRSLMIPLLLVLIVQCGIFITVTVVGWQGYSIYYLALLMVECILMGATIDYGILFTNYYREYRRELPAPKALRAAYEGSIHSIMTSGLIIVLITAVFGYAYPDPTIAEICRTLSTGALSVILVILFLLPAMLAAFDRLVIRRPKKKLPSK